MNKIVLVVTKLVAYLTSPTYTDEQIKFAYQLRQQGMTYKMIARKTGISERTQQRRFKDMTCSYTENPDRFISRA